MICVARGRAEKRKETAAHRLVQHNRLFTKGEAMSQRLKGLSHEEATGAAGQARRGAGTAEAPVRLLSGTPSLE